MLNSVIFGSILFLRSSGFYHFLLLVVLRESGGGALTIGRAPFGKATGISFGGVGEGGDA